MKMILRIWKLTLTCCLLSFLIGCASTGSPSGGPRDKTPPGVVEEKSSQNFSTNFTPEKLELVFDEWIELKNQQREILISPPFFNNPKITSRGKKIMIEFPKEEPLREDATYTINFGKSIVDFTEGNAAEGFRFVFATGDKIDSLSFAGSIEEARDGKPVKDILVLLYDVLEDSIIISEKPFYYARTDDSGTFKFENLKNDTFKLFVLEDLNFNYLLDPELERLAFPDSLFILNDSSEYNPKLRLFAPQQSLRITNSNSQIPGLITTVFNKPAEKVDYHFLYPEDFDPLIEKNKDTLMFWFTQPLDSLGVIYDLDTLDFTIKAFDSIFYAGNLSLIDFNTAKTTLAPFDSLKISFNAPLVEIDTSLIRLTNPPVSRLPESAIDSVASGKRGLLKDALIADTSAIEPDALLSDSANTNVDTIPNGTDSLQIDKDSFDRKTDTSGTPVNFEAKDSLGIDSFGLGVDILVGDSLSTVPDTAQIEYEFGQRISLRNLYIDSKWKEKSTYRLELLPGAVTDIYGRQNDSLLLDFKTAGLDEFGSITINLSGLDSAQHYVILLKLNDEIIKKSQVVDVDSTNHKIEYKQLRVNTYSIELIKDDNNDGEWTTGDYWLNRQPEELKIFTLEKLREDWDLEANVFWDETKTSTLDASGIERDSTSGRLPPERLKGKKPGSRINKSEGSPKIVPKLKGKND